MKHGKEGDIEIPVDCPMNIPAIPVLPTCTIPDIGIRDRWFNTCPRLFGLRDKVSTLFEYVARSCSVAINTKRGGSNKLIVPKVVPY